jgi:ABC-type multidrug transport system fused ATPase/permease subunit
MADENPLTSFIKEEKLGDGGSLIRLNLRLFRGFPLFLRLLPLSIVAIVASSAAPSFFRWYAGGFSEQTRPVRIPVVGIPLAFTLRGMVWITLAATVCRIAAWALFEMSAMWSTQSLHSRMVRSLSRTRTTYFDENPSGRLINRLIRDYDEVRGTAVIFVGDLFNASIEVLGIAVVASLASPWAALMLLPLLAAFSYIQYQRSGMLDHARALSAVATSRVLGRKTDLIEGRGIFLLFGQSRTLLLRMSRSFGDYVRASALTVFIDTWLSFWIRFSAEVFSLAVLLLLAFALTRHRVDATLAGVIISSLFGITASIGWLDFATGMVSRSTPHLRRVFEIIDLPPEEHEEREARKEGAPLSKTSPPLRGDLVFDDYSMSYRRDTPVILSGLNLRFEEGSKTALVGRTGSGKTSITQALLRMVYVRGGDVRFGGQSIYECDVQDYRRSFGVVPQFPYLFSGTVRSNLDRQGALESGALEAALEAVGLSYPLDQPVNEGGQNLSLGERQLICLARVIAARKPIILMDEPTSGLDPETDARVSRIFRSAFRDRTVITIAHRRESLGSYDRIVELSGGKVIREGTP